MRSVDRQAMAESHGEPGATSVRTVLVTGSNGFVGGAVLHALHLAMPSLKVVLAGRQSTERDRGGLHRVHLDLARGEIELPDGIDVVLHLAGEKRDASRMTAVNHEGAVRLAEAAARAGVRRFVHLSSVGVYGARKHAGVVDESSRRAPSSLYEVSKDAGERAVRGLCADLGMGCVVLQPSNVIGVVQGQSYPLLGLTRSVARGWFRYFGRGDAWLNYISVEDVASALAAAVLDDAANGVFILNTPATLVAVVDWIAEELGIPKPTSRLPTWVGAVAAGASPLSATMLKRNLPLTPERYRELTNTTRYDGTAINRALGFDYPVGIEASLRSMLRQYRREGLV